MDLNSMPLEVSTTLLKPTRTQPTWVKSQVRQDGYDFWLGAMGRGASREDILASFSESKENIDNVADLIANGIQYQEWLG